MQIFQTDLHAFPLRISWENADKRLKNITFGDRLINSQNLFFW